MIFISLTTISLAIYLVKPVLDGMHNAAILNEALSNMNRRGNTLTEVAAEWLGGKRTMQLQVSGGGYAVSNSFSSLYFDYYLRNELLGHKIFVKYGNVWLLTCPVGGKTNLELMLNCNTIIITGDSKARVESLGCQPDQKPKSRRLFKIQQL